MTKVAPLRDALAQASRVVGKLENLSKVHLLGSGEGVTVSATNLSASIRVRVPADFPGEALVECRQLLKLLDSLTAGDVKLSMSAGKEDHLQVESEGVSAKLWSADPSDFPRFPEVTGEPWWLPAPALRRVLERGRLALRVNGRELSNTIRLWSEGGELQAASTNENRLTHAREPVEGLADGDIWIPGGALDALGHALPVEGDVEVTLGMNHTRFVAGDLTFWAIRADAYPRAWDAALKAAESDKPHAVLPAESAAAALKRCLLTAGDSRAVKISWRDGVVSFESRGALVGQSKTDVKAETAGESTLAINASYLLDALALGITDQVELKCRNNNDLVTLRFRGAEGAFQVASAQMAL